MSPLLPLPVKDQDIEIENECEFLIDESDGVPFSSFSIPHKNKQSKKDGSAIPVSKSQSSEKEKTESKKGKNRKVQLEALTTQKMDDLDVRVHDFKGTSGTDPVSNSEGKVLKSQRQKSTHMGKLFNRCSDFSFQVILLNFFVVVYWEIWIMYMRDINGFLIDVSVAQLGLGVYKAVWDSVFTSPSPPPSPSC